MKIDPKVQLPIESQPERVSGKRAKDAQVTGTSADKGVSSPSGQDTVHLSGAHSDVQKLTYSVSRLPEVRAERVADLKPKVQSGDYKPESGKIADAIIAEQKQHKFKP